MLKSIKYFEENCISIFEKLEDDFMKNPTALAEYVIGLTAELHTLGICMLQESLEAMDQMLQDSPIRKKSWYVESHTSKQLLTSLGTVHFKKTLFTNKETGTSEYLLDRILQIDKHERMTEDAEARMLLETVQTSYRCGGEEASLMSEVSKQTVKNKLHNLSFPKNKEKPEKKREVEYLYIDADEDHVSLQFHEKKGDLITGENHQKNNCLISKLVYVYEGIEKESPQSKRSRLINPYYFCRVCSGEDNRKFWDEIYEYLESHYELRKVKKIYVNGDGGGWIKAGMEQIPGKVYVLDSYHLEKHLIKLTSHMLDSQEDARSQLRKIIKFKGKKEFEEKVIELSGYLKDERGTKRLQESKEYILSNWMAARKRLEHKDGVIGCSAEGHVSHVLSSRMSSRPMGWSRTGAAKMSELRAYYLNGGDMLELVRYQKRELPKAAGAENEILTLDQVLSSERNRHKALGKYVESIHHSVSLDTKKKVYFNAHIWGL